MEQPEPEFRDFLKAVMKKHITQKGKAVLHGGLGLNIKLDTLVDTTNQEYDQMEANLEVNASKLAEEIVEELEAREFKSPDDLTHRADELKRVIDAYERKLVKSVK